VPVGVVQKKRDLPLAEEFGQLILPNLELAEAAISVLRDAGLDLDRITVFRSGIVPSGVILLEVVLLSGDLFCTLPRWGEISCGGGEYILPREEGRHSNHVRGVFGGLYIDRGVVWIDMSVSL